MPPQEPSGAGAGARPATWQDLIEAEARKQQIDPRLARAIAEVESGFDPAAKSPAGAIGLMQLMPATAKRHGVDPTDPVQNIRGGIAELKALLTEHKGDVVLTLRRYNASPQAADTVTDPYVQKVLGRLQQGGTGAPGGPPAGPTRGRLVGAPPTAAVQPAPAEEATPAHLRDIRLLPGETELPGWDPSLKSVNDPTLLESMALEFDPTTRRGRRNIAGGVGAAGLIALAPFTGGGSLTGLGALATGVTGAAAGGTLMELGEQVVGTKPPSTTAALGAGAQQGAYETLGQGFIWPIKAIGRRVIASKVGRAAHEGLQQARAATMTRLGDALDAASQAAGDVKALVGETIGFTRRRAAEALRGARGAAQEGMREARGAAESLVGRPPTDVVSTARRTAAEGIRGARALGRAGVKEAELQAGERTAAVSKPYSQLVGESPSVAGRMAAEVLEGPAKEARDIVGKQVEQAAREGPPVNIAALKAEAQQILERLKPPERAFPRRLPEEAPEVAATALPGGDAASVARLEQQAARADADGAQARAILAARQTILADLEAAQTAAGQETLKHPAMGVINRILNADDVVPFYDAHLWKSELQNALQGTYDKAVKKQVTSITQRLTSGLRDALRGHAPYDQATAAYQQIVPWYTKELAAKLRKDALTDPEALIRNINPRKPTAVRMLRDVLVTQSAAGGDARMGQQAWDAVRSAWTGDNILKYGVEQLDAQLAKLPREFTSVFYGDASGSQVLRNLQTIASAYKAAVQAGEREVLGAKEAASAGVEAAQRAGRLTIEEAQRQLARLRSAGAAGVERARVAGKETVETTRQITRSQVDQALREGTRVKRQAADDVTAARRQRRVYRITPTAEELRFAQSSIAGRQPSVEELVAHGLRAFILGPAQIWGGLSWLKLLKGPAEKDLLEWAAYSPQNTQRLVSLMTGPSPTGLAIADLLRSTGLFGDAEEDEQTPASRVGTPQTLARGPGARGQVAAPPGRGPGSVGTPPPR